MWLDSIIYSSWVSAKLKCGYASDSAFAGHLLSLEQRRKYVYTHKMIQGLSAMLVSFCVYSEMFID